MPHNELLVFGALMLTAGLLARFGRRVGLPTVPFFMAAGVLLGPGTPGPVLIEDPESLHLLAVLGLVLLLFQLGVEFPVKQVLSSGRRLFTAAACYIGLNIGAGLAFGFLLGWGTGEALVVGGALGISSSAIAIKILIELRRLTNAETPVILGIIVIEDLFLAFYLALIQPVLSDASSPTDLVVQIITGFGFLALLFVLARFGARLIGAVINSREDELLTILMVGLVALVAGLSEELGVSEAIGALMIGLVVSRTSVRERVERLVLPLRDAFAAAFFVYFGLGINVADLPAVAVPALLAVVMTVVTNLTAGVIAGRLHGFNQRATANIGLTVLGRGEFSLILVTLALGAGLDPRLGPFVALYVLVLAVLSPLMASGSRYLARVLPDSLLVSNWRYVREETIGTSCSHLDQVVVTEPDGRECAECARVGATWVHLRLCTACGTVACCDDSVNKHAGAHFRESGHPIVQSIEPGEDWRYCYVDAMLVREPAGGGREPERG
ncbi:cation:proton antiporter domain-containing protein [Actinorugispora endophytica]|uniref:CPA2 family monovalent cation:H+ antiporter-2 n=1 Tax=Actinorugispora endophytica TaxID=1605990 RepID=A0A4R6UJ05_9ACTN|nr:cation:proton antiporter [Actinorugispora endophytica]TDQ46888.1 CPA2 family monovalent cation:H+ antiporter-2 [Actinorugispora endophytica]